MYQIQNNRSKLAVSACFILITAFVITGCSGASSKNEVQKDTSNITMAAIIEANKSQNILSKHGSIFVEDSTADNEEVYYTYVSADYMYQKSGESNIVVSEEENWECDEDNGERTFYYYWFAMDENEEKEMRSVPSDYEYIEEVYTGREKIENIQENSDGTLTITTLLGTDDVKEFYDSYQIEYPQGLDTLEQRSEYVVDGNTLEISSVYMTVFYDGSEASNATRKITYDAEQPDELNTLTELIYEYKNDKTTNERTAKVIYDYGTDREQSYEFKANQKYRVIVNTRDGYDYLYTDPEKTQEYDGGDGVSDITIYAFTEE